MSERCTHGVTCPRGVPTVVQEEIPTVVQGIPTVVQGGYPRWYREDIHGGTGGIHPGWYRRDIPRVVPRRDVTRVVHRGGCTLPYYPGMYGDTLTTPYMPPYVSPGTPCPPWYRLIMLDG